MSQDHCTVCSHPIEDGAFCHHCGAHIETGSAHRWSAFAGQPNEHVLVPNPVSTLFPHLTGTEARLFAVGGTVGVLALIALALLRLTGPSLVLACAAVPLLYLLYLWETHVFAERPATVFLSTVVFAALLGALWGLWTGPLVSQAHLLNIMPHGSRTSDGFKAATLIPLGAQALMLVVPVTLLLRRRNGDGLDGYTIGAAAALGFTLGATAMELHTIVEMGLVTTAQPVSFAMRTLLRGLLVPVVDALATGLVAGSLWVRHEENSGRLRTWVTNPAFALLAAIAVQFVMGLIAVYIESPVTSTVLTFAMAIALLLWTRLALHQILLAGTRTAPANCSHCGTEHIGSSFCTECGQATKVGARPSRPPLGLRRHGPAFILAGGALAVSAVALGVASSLFAPGQVRCEGRGCSGPPPRIHLQATSSGQSAFGANVYTSSKYHFSLEYANNKPSNTDSSSVEWDGKLSDGSVVAWTFFGDTPNGRTPQQIVNAIQNSHYPDASYVYTIPGADVGYTAGYGRVYDVTVSPDFGSDIHARLIIISAIKKGTVVNFLGLGSYRRSTPDVDGHPNPAATPLVNLGEVERTLKSVAWPGDARL